MDITKREIFLAATPILSFIGAYIFETGYADAFGYPYELIEIDLRATVISLILGISILAPAYLFYALVFTFALRPELELRFIAMNFVYSIPALILAYALGFSSIEINLLLLLSVLAGLIIPGWYIIKHRNLPWNEALKIAASTQGIKERNQHTSTEEIQLSARDRVYQAVFIIAVLAVLAVLALMLRGAGSAVALWKSSYHTFLINDQEVAILAAYGDALVLGGVTDDMFNGTISVIPKNSESIKQIRLAHMQSFLPTNKYKM